jgi:fucose 4-O-acetylase-like acetyltransferase
MILNALQVKPVIFQRPHVNVPRMTPVSLPSVLVTNVTISVLVSLDHHALVIKTAQKAKFVTRLMQRAVFVYLLVIAVLRFTAALTSTATPQQVSAKTAAAMLVTASLAMSAKTMHVYLVTAQLAQPALQ